MILHRLLPIILVSQVFRTSYVECFSIFGIDFESLFRTVTVAPTRALPYYSFRWGPNFNETALHDLERTYKSRIYQNANAENRKKMIGRFMDNLHRPVIGSKDVRPYENLSSSVNVINRREPSDFMVTVSAEQALSKDNHSPGNKTVMSSFDILDSIGKSRVVSDIDHGCLKVINDNQNSPSEPLKELSDHTSITSEAPLDNSSILLNVAIPHADKFTPGFVSPKRRINEFRRVMHGYSNDKFRWTEPSNFYLENSMGHTIRPGNASQLNMNDKTGEKIEALHGDNPKE